MLKYVILIGLFRAYLLGLFLFWLHAISVGVFGKQRGKPKRMLRACLIAFVWPVAVFSPEGRKQLFSNIKRY